MQPNPSPAMHRAAATSLAGCLAVAALPADVRAGGSGLLTGYSSELLSTDDILLTDSDLTVRWRDTRRELTLLGGHATMGIDYVPPPGTFMGHRQELDDIRTSGQFTWREGLDRPWRWTVSAGGYEGFTDYRSLWLDEYYRQIFGGARGYQEADVGGYNFSVGGTYEYLPISGLINWSVGRQVDDVSPAYEKQIGKPLVRGIDEYQTWRYGLGSEHVLSPCLRFKQDATAYQTTAREWRYAYRAEAAWAFADEWALRFATEGSLEGDFHSAMLSLNLERDWDARWFAGVRVRGYRDNGQVIDPLVIAGSSPPLDTLEAQLTLRYSGPDLTFRVGVGPYLTRYGELGPGSTWFSTLYHNRDWLSLQTSVSWRF